MTTIVYDVNDLIIDVHYDKVTHALKWAIQSMADTAPSFNAEQIKKIILQLEKSLDVDIEVNLD